MDWFLSLLFCTLSLLFSVLFILQRLKHGKVKTETVGDNHHLRPIPQVSGGLPIIGHLLQIVLYPESFIDSCYNKYGPVFRLKLLSTRMAFICDRNLFQKIWNRKDLLFPNLYEVLEPEPGAADLHTHLQLTMRKHATENSFPPQLLAGYAESLMEKLDDVTAEKTGSKGAVNIDEIFAPYLYQALCHAFFGTDVSRKPKIFDAFQKFSATTELAVSASYFLPKGVINWMLKSRLQNSLTEVSHFLMEHLNKESNESIDLVRKVFDKGEPDGSPISGDELARGFLKMNVAVVPNLSAGVLNSIYFLHQNPETLKTAREEATFLMGRKDYKAIVDSPILTSCFLEAARLKAHYLGTTFRIIANEKLQEVGDYSLRDVDHVLFGGHVSTAGEAAGDVFEDCKSYQPSRWLNSRTLHRQSNFPIFGGGLHYCQGKQGAIAITNMTLAHFLTRFELDMSKTTVSEVSAVFGVIRPIKLRTCIKKINS